MSPRHAVCNGLALFLILSPLEIPVPSQVPAPVFAGLQRVAQGLDLVDERDRWRPDFAVEVRWCRVVWRQLHTCPPSCEVLLLPPHEYCQSCVVQLHVFHAYLCCRRLVLRHQADAIGAILVETRLLTEIWRTAAEATDPTTLVRTQRLALNRLRELLGDQYPHLPPSAPVWRLGERD